MHRSVLCRLHPGPRSGAAPSHWTPASLRPPQDFLGRQKSNRPRKNISSIDSLLKIKIYPAKFLRYDETEQPLRNLTQTRCIFAEALRDTFPRCLVPPHLVKPSQRSRGAQVISMKPVPTFAKVTEFDQKEFARN